MVNSFEEYQTNTINIIKLLHVKICMRDFPKEGISQMYLTTGSFFTALVLRQLYCGKNIGKCFYRLIFHWNNLHLIIIAKT